MAFVNSKIVTSLSTQKHKNVVFGKLKNRNHEKHKSFEKSIGLSRTGTFSLRIMGQHKLYTCIPIKRSFISDNFFNVSMNLRDFPNYSIYEGDKKKTQDERRDIIGKDTAVQYNKTRKF